MNTVAPASRREPLNTVAPTSRRDELRTLAALFLRLGTTAFGGPAVHIAMMEEEVVRRRRWLTHEEFLDYLGATNLIPGPNSTEMALHVGHARAGWAGLVVAGLCFILPATLIVGVIAWAYVRFGTLPAAAGLLYGVKPVVIAVVLQALWGLSRSAVRTPWLGALAAVGALAAATGVDELLVLAVSGAAAAVALRPRNPDSARASMLAWIPAGLLSPGGAAAAAGIGLWPLFALFAKVGAVLFGSGYVLLAFLRSDLVERLHWITEQQLLDAVAVGQITPGPVFTTATFVGYVLAGANGAAVATAGIFLPAFAFVALSGVILPRLRRSGTARAVLDGVNVASLALMAVVTAQLARAALVDATTVGAGAIAAVLLLRYRVNSAWLVLGGAALGLLTHGWHG